MQKPADYFPPKIITINDQDAWLIHPFDEAQAQGPFSAPKCDKGYSPLTTPRIQPGVPALSFPLLDKIIDQKIPVELKCSRMVNWYDPIGNKPMRINGIKVVTPVYHPHLDQILPDQYSDVFLPKCVSGPKVGTLTRLGGNYFEFTPEGEDQPWARLSIFDLETQIQIQTALIGGFRRRKISRRIKKSRRNRSLRYA